MATSVHIASSDMKIELLAVRSILNSQGGLSVEAEVDLQGCLGRGSAPRAIIPGRRERQVTENSELGCMNAHPYVQRLKEFLEWQRFEGQLDFDEIFENNGEFSDIGSDISLAVSLAFCRANASVDRQPLHKRISDLAGCTLAMPRPMINIFSGGVHGGHIPFQQLMIIPHENSIVDNLKIAVSLYDDVESFIKSKDLFEGYSASSGMLTKGTNLYQLFDIIASTIERHGLQNVVSLGTDVAAEHLEVGKSQYQLGKNETLITADDLNEIHRKLLDSYNFAFYEDPFGPNDEVQWRSLTSYAKEKTVIVGDDLFATNVDNLSPGLASGILLKMNQIGTVSGTVRAANAARSMNMRLCVSHRSKETEDTAMCDLAVGLGADLIKIGGPRRGDRISKYNQLLRLSEDI